MRSFMGSNLIRITSGILKGQAIKSPNSGLTHPMGAREKLALFNMISGNLPGATVLDAFAGSGALGIEAFSRGANIVTFIEKDRRVAENLIENLRSVGIGSAEIEVMAVRQFRTNKEYDVILADPPYDDFEISDVVYLTGFLKDGGIFVLSHPDSAPVIDGLKLTKSRKYARANISIYEKLA